MARQPQDKKTLPLPEVARPRGRPPTGCAKTAAERKREQRSRDHAALYRWDSDSGPDYVTVTLDGLLSAVRHCVTEGQVERLVELSAELRRRAKAEAKTRAAVL